MRGQRLPLNGRTEGSRNWKGDREPSPSQGLSGVCGSLDYQPKRSKAHALFNHGFLESMRGQRLPINGRTEGSRNWKSDRESSQAWYRFCSLVIGEGDQNSLTSSRGGKWVRGERMWMCGTRQVRARIYMPLSGGAMAHKAMVN